MDPPVGDDVAPQNAPFASAVSREERAVFLARAQSGLASLARLFFTSARVFVSTRPAVFDVDLPSKANVLKL